VVMGLRTGTRTQDGKVAEHHPWATPHRRSCEGMGPLGILESWNLGILESWNLGILESWNLGILESWNL
jgi:hypothetical protein